MSLPLSGEQIAEARRLRAAGAMIEVIARHFRVTEACICHHTRGYASVSPAANRARSYASRVGVDIPLDLVDDYLATRRASGHRLSPAETLNTVLVARRRTA